jgi:hypothetical protein
MSPSRVIVSVRGEYLTVTVTQNLERSHSRGALSRPRPPATGLQELQIERCSYFEELPTCVGYLTSLDTLDLAHLHNLETLPLTIGELTGLQTLRIRSCFLTDMPRSIEALTALKTLSVTSNGSGYMTFEEAEEAGNTVVKALARSLPSLMTLDIEIFKRYSRQYVNIVPIGLVNIVPIGLVNIVPIGLSLKAWPPSSLLLFDLTPSLHTYWRELGLPTEAEGQR